MASSGINNATLVALYIGGTKITHLTNVEFSPSSETIEVTSKDSGGDAEFIYGKRSGTYSGEAFFAEDAAYAYTTLWTAMKNRTTLTARYTSNVSGDLYYEATVLVTSVPRSAPTEDAETYTVEFQITGAVTEGTET